MLSSTTFGAKKRSNQVGLYPAAFKDLSTLSNPTIWNWLEKATDKFSYFAFVTRLRIKWLGRQLLGGDIRCVSEHHKGFINM
jgi:hypothetical protein